MSPGDIRVARGRVRGICICRGGYRAHVKLYFRLEAVQYYLVTHSLTGILKFSFSSEKNPLCSFEII